MDGEFECLKNGVHALDCRLELVAGLGKDHVVVHEPLVANPVLLAQILHRPIQRRQVQPAQQG